MAYPISPGVTVTESEVGIPVPGVATAVGAIAGAFRWGPVGERVLVDSEKYLVERFGSPTDLNPETFFTAASFLAYSTALSVVRAANTTGLSPILTGNVVAANSIVNVGNTVNVTNGMILVDSSNPEAVNVGTTVSVVNSTHIALQSGGDAFANQNAVTLQLVANVTAFNAVVNTASIANLTHQIVRTEDEFNVKLGNDDFDSDLLYLAKWPGAIGNSLKVSVCDSADAFDSTVDLTSNGDYSGSITYTVDSNSATVSLGKATAAETFDVNTFNTFVDNLRDDIVIGDAIVAGNTQVGEQHVNVTTVTADDAVALLANVVQTINVSSGSASVDTTASAFSVLSAGDVIAVWANSTSWTSYVVDSVASGNSATLSSNALFTNTGAVWAKLDGYSRDIDLTFVDKYKRSQNVTSTSLSKKWEYFDTFDGAPGQSTFVRLNGNTSANDELHMVVVDEDGKFTGVPGTILEKFERLSRATDSTDDDGRGNYYLDVINTTSNYVWVVDDRAGAPSANAANVTTSLNDVPLTSPFRLGMDGSDEGTISIGVLSDAWDRFADKDEADVSLLMVGKARGGTAGGQLANYLIDNIAEPRMDCVVFASPDRDDVVNNAGSEAVDIVEFRNTLRSSSYGFLDSGYKYTYDRYNDVYRYVPLNGDMAGLTARTEQTNDAWWSPAGYNRGKVKNIVRLAYSPRKADRDVLYKNGINPVVTFKGDGTILFGDKTLLAKPSAFDRINVRRLFIVLEKAISEASKYSLFEFNDAFTRAAFRNMVVPYLRDVQGRRGIQDFLVVCDSTNNPPVVIDRNEFVGDIYIKPARSISYILLNFIAVPTGVAFSEIVVNS